MHIIITTAKSSEEIFAALEGLDGVALFVAVDNINKRLEMHVSTDAGAANLRDYLTALDRGGLID